MNTKVTYHFLLFKQLDLFRNEVLEEVLRERINFYTTQNKQQDFWVLTFPNFLKDKTILQKVSNTAYGVQHYDTLFPMGSKYPFMSAVISTNKEFINWLSLRAGFFENMDLSVSASPKGTEEQPSVTMGQNIIASNGLRGEITIDPSKENNINPLSSSYYVHPTLMVERFKKALQYSYNLF